MKGSPYSGNEGPARPLKIRKGFWSLEFGIETKLQGFKSDGVLTVRVRGGIYSVISKSFVSQDILS